jgi:hypothetical protein
MVSEGFQGGCRCENVAGLRHGTDNVEIAALAAPRPMKLIGATGDWTVNTNSHILPVLRDVYRIVGAEDRVAADTFTAEHNYNRTSREAVYPFLTGTFLGWSDPERSREGELTPEKPEDLLVFGESHPAPADRKDAAAVGAWLVERRAADVAAMAPDPGRPAAWAAAREGLATAHRVRTGVRVPAAEEVEATEVRRADRGRVQVAQRIVGTSAGGERVPVVVLTPEKPTGGLTVVMSGRGRAGLVGGDGAFTPLVARLLAAGQVVVGFDPLLSGESVNPESPTSERPATSHYATYNRVLAADRMHDLAIVVGYARELSGVSRVSLVGIDGAGPLALLALPRLEGVSRAYVDLEGFDYGDGGVAVSRGLDLPGVLQMGGLPAAAALAAPRGLVVARPGTPELARWAGGAYAAAGVPAAVRAIETPADAASLAEWFAAGTPLGAE